MDWRETSIYMLAIVGGITCFWLFVGGIQSCSKRTDENRLECIKAGKTPDECMRLFRN